MHTLLVLLQIVTVVVLALSVTGVLLVRRAIRRLRRNVRARIAAAGMNGAASALSRPVGGQPDAWSSPPLQPRPDRLTAATVGPLLSARAWLPGPTRAVSLMRRDLHRDLTATSRALSAARMAGRPSYELESRLALLAEHERQLQLNLQIIAAEPDHQARAQLLSAYVAQASVIRRTCANVRAAVLSEGCAYDEPALREIVDDINDAVITADLRARAHRELSGM